MKLFTIGFTKKNAESFFTALQQAKIKRLLDVRLNNRSQLAGFSKADDLRYFLHAIAGIEYRHLPELAPTQEMLDAYKKHDGSWAMYETQFVNLLESRQVEVQLEKSLFDNACLLCSEHLAHHCHRRLVAEYLKSHWGDVSIEHLV
jgi:uncharacterized protein (DUF488 family)